MFLSFANRFRLSNLIANQNAINIFRYANVNAPSSSSSQTDGETKLNEILKKRFPDARLVDVKDTSSGCGASYEIIVVTDEFAKMRTVNQHRLVSDALSKQLPNIHAIRIFTGTDEKQFLDS
ncbi:unnamed protein product [Adineta steineri]|uniref:BolA-like protein n=1 Tax=Adineta steineri TaxID=433720 RepID=A0A815XHX3_9BILA|nr:unnamed protein product [Adineta steineri]CAF1272646.1 unnamed protein product [Adineta steineri]CAF1526203.1 unnamed protein product [Adineta steineri]CAF1557941.1 unnamed protein product [Adineta steineri]